MIVLKKNFSEYTESEFRRLVEAIVNVEVDDDDTDDEYLENFIAVTEHPDGSDLIYYPENGDDVTVDSIIKEVKEWRAKNGKPGFKAG